MSTDVNALTIVRPLPITDTILDVSGSPPATNVPENDYPEWDSGTTYNDGDRVILTSTHKVYESLLNSNTGNNPTVTSSPIYWIEVSPTNRWAVFDTSVSTQTAQANNITYRLIPGQAINTVAVLNITNGTQLTVRMISPGTGSPGIVYEKVVDLTGLPLAPGWWEWFYGAKIVPSQSILLDLPSYSDCELEIELLGASDLAVGVILIGQQQNFGLGIKYGARVGIQDYSRKETNEFGDTVLVQRAFAKRANFDLFLNNAEVDSFQTALSTIRATPVLWIGSTAFESTTLFGFYKNFDILISYANHSDCELEVEGLV
jgi:hypothetical protein